MCVAGTDGYFKELNAAWTEALGLMSGFADSTIPTHLGDSHSTFLGKPFGKRELRSALQRVLDSDRPA